MTYLHDQKNIVTKMETAVPKRLKLVGSCLIACDIVRNWSTVHDSAMQLSEECEPGTVGSDNAPLQLRYNVYATRKAKVLTHQ